MKKIIAIILFLWCSNAYASYTGTMPKDIGTSTPAGSENPNVIDDVLRERGTILYNVYKIKNVGTDTTLVANDSWVIASSTSNILLTMPAASSVANSSATKPFFIKNTNTGTVTLNITVDGVGSPTVSGSQTMCLFTDGTLWYEINAKNAYDSDYLGGVIASGYARSGANSDITSLSGMTTALPISEGGTGQTTAAAAATALGLGTGNSPTFAGVTATTGSITTLTSTTVNATNVSGAAGTFTGNLQIGSLSGLTDSSVPDNITLTNITQITNRSHTNLSDIGSNSHVAIDSHIASSSDPHGANLTQTNETITTGTVTTLYSTTGNITTGNVTNLNTTSGTITTLNSTTGNIGNISGTAGTWTGNINAASASGFNYLSRWRSGSTIGTGTVAVQGSGDIIVTPTYSNANGTITISLSGSASAKPNVKYNATQIIGNTTDINFTSPLRVVGSGSTEAVISVDNISLGTQTNGTINLSTQTSGLLSLGTQTNGSLAWNVINTGTPTDNTNFKTIAGTSTVPVRDTDGNLFVSGIVGGTTTGALKIPTGTTAQRPGTPTAGMIRYNTSLCKAEIYIEGWTISGGSATVSGDYTYMTFTSSSNITVTPSPAWYPIGTTTPIIGTSTPLIEYFIVAGGGGGGFNYSGAGGGGAGGYLNSTTTISGTVTVTIGSGGAAGAVGNNSALGSFTANGGGNGGDNGVGGNGGSGGGGGNGGYAGGTGSQGYGGGTANGTNGGGGGGGAGAAGANGALNVGGNGGIGIVFNGTYYAGGGGGRSAGTGGTGGTGGGGSCVGDTGQNGTDNTGGGGGGGAGIGGSGIVIVKYLTNQ